MCVRVRFFLRYFLMVPLRCHTLTISVSPVPSVTHVSPWSVLYLVYKWIFKAICSAVLKTDIVPWTLVPPPSYSLSLSLSGPTLSLFLMLLISHSLALSLSASCSFLKQTAPWY